MARSKLSATLLGIGLLAGCGGDDVPADVMQGVWSQCRVDVNVDCSTIALPLSDCKFRLSWVFADGGWRTIEFPTEVQFVSQAQSYCVVPPDRALRIRRRRVEHHRGRDEH